jgi:transposase-like protein
MIDFSQFDSLMTMTGYFNSEDICRQAIVNSRYDNGKVVCPHCGSHRISVRQDGRYRCKDCKHNFSSLVGTIFENTNLPLQKWFIAMYLISSHKKGISSCQLARDIKVSQTTAWNMLHKVRKLYAQDDSDALNGTVECDEVYIGGKEKWKHQSMKTPRTQGRSTKTKTPVFGMMERTEIENAKGEKEFMSYVKALVVENTTSATLKPVISQFIADGSTVYTDELSAYNGLANMGYSHNICNHSGLEFVTEDGEVYTNNIEGFWSHFRRMIIGCYHDCSDEHLQAYVDEACFRWNTRKMSESERFGIMFRKSVGLVVRWKDLALCDRKKVA